MEHKDATTLSMAGPSKRSEDSSTSSSSIDTFSALVISKRDVGPILLAVFFALLGVAVCCICYFTIQARDNIDILDQLKLDCGTTVIKLQSALDSVKSNVEAVQSYYSTMNDFTNIQYEAEWLTVNYNEDNQFFPYISRIDLCPRIENKDITSFIQKTRARGGIFANYDLFTREASNLSKKLPVNMTADFFAPAMMIAPVGNEWFLGMDYWADLRRRADLTRSLVSKRSTLSTFMHGTNSSFHTLIFPVVNVYNNNVTGGVFARIEVDTVLKTVVGDTLVNDGVVFTLFQLNFTNKVGGLFTYTTAKNAAEDQVTKLIQSTKFNAEGIVRLSDGYFRLVVTASDVYIEKNTPIDKIIAIVVVIIASIILMACSIGLMFVSRILRVLKSRKNSKRRLAVLKNNQETMRALLARIMKQEAKFKTCLNCIPEFMAMISSNGKIMHTNSGFDKIFKYSEQRLEQGITITWLFPKLEPHFFKRETEHSDDDYGWIQAVAVDSEEKEVAVKFTIRNLNDSAIKDDNVSDIMTRKEIELQNVDEETYVLIGKVVSN